MELELINNEKGACALIKSDDRIIQSVQDALDLMADCRYQGAFAIIIEEHHLLPDFFDWKSGIAGEILQKFSNYQMKLAVMGDFSRYTSKSLRDFIGESNRHGRICFVSNRDEAIKMLGA